MKLKGNGRNQALIKSDGESEAAETMTGKIAHQQDISNVDFSSSAFD